MPTNEPEQAAERMSPVELRYEVQRLLRRQPSALGVPVAMVQRDARRCRQPARRSDSGSMQSKLARLRASKAQRLRYKHGELRGAQTQLPGHDLVNGMALDRAGVVVNLASSQICMPPNNPRLTILIFHTMVPGTKRAAHLGFRSFTLPPIRFRNYGIHNALDVPRSRVDNTISDCNQRHICRCQAPPRNCYDNIRNNSVLLIDGCWIYSRFQIMSRLRLINISGMHNGGAGSILGIQRRSFIYIAMQCYRQFDMELPLQHHYITHSRDNTVAPVCGSGELTGISYCIT